MEVVEEPEQSKSIPPTEVFSYSDGSPQIGSRFEKSFTDYTVLSDGRVRDENARTFTLGRYFFIVSGHIVGITTYQNKKVVMRCAKCSTSRTATKSTCPDAKFYILGWFKDNECQASE